MALVDCFTRLERTELPVLDDGFVRLIDAMPRLVPEGRDCGAAIVRSARVSYGLGLKTPEEDERLLAYLVKNQHTSPLESVKFTFHIRCPLFVAVHLLRHRTANVNMFSARYAEVKDDAYFHPDAVLDGIRLQSKTNKQLGVAAPVIAAEVRTKFQELNGLLDQVFVKYHELLDLGVAREVARYALPEATYTELYYTMDLNNLVKFFRLRCDRAHAQLETVLFAEAMWHLVAPLVPTVLSGLVSTEE